MPDHRQEDKLHTWEVVHEQGGIERTYRMCVPGGWLYRHVYSPSKGLPECCSCLACRRSLSLTTRKPPGPAMHLQRWTAVARR